MTRREALLVLAYLASNYPFVRLPEETIDVWVNEVLSPLDVETARAAVARARDTLPRFPSIAEFLGIYRAEQAMRRPSAPAQPAEGSAEEDRDLPDEVRAWMRERGIGVRGSLVRSL